MGAITFGIIQTIEHPELYEEKSKVEEAVGCSQEEAESIEDVLNKCDITDYQDVKADEGLNGAWKKNDKGFRIEIQDGMEVLMWLNKNNKVIILKYDENMIYKKGILWRIIRIGWMLIWIVLGVWSKGIKTTRQSLFGL